MFITHYPVRARMPCFGLCAETNMLKFLLWATRCKNININIFILNSLNIE